MRTTESGFTLVELMIGMAMSGIVVAIIYSAYNIQTTIYSEQDKVSDMQQNIRASLFYLQREARMAGYDPDEADDPMCGTDAGTPGIHTATANTFGFSMALNGDGDCSDEGENITYTIYKSTETDTWNLGRNDTNGAHQQAVAENITKIEFIYLFKPSLGGPTSTPAANQLRNIHAAQVAVLAQAKYKDRKSPVAQSFTVPRPDVDDWGEMDPEEVISWEPVPGFSGRMLTTTINLRNMGL